MGDWKIKNKTRKLNGIFSVNLSSYSQKLSVTALELKNLPSLDNIDTEQQISFYDWILYNKKRKFAIIYRNDLKKSSICSISK